MAGLNNRGFWQRGMIFCAFFTFISLTYAGTYSGGSGAAEDPYKISTVADWQELIATSADWDRHFLLLNDIDFTGIALTPIAPDSDPSAYDYQGTWFNGTFDGSGYTLGHVTIDLPSQDAVGLFGGVGLVGTVRNLRMAEATIAGRSEVGGLVGMNRGTVADDVLSGRVSGGSGIGGMIGHNHGAGLHLSCSGIVSGWVNGVGGLVGWNDSGSLENCFSACRVDGSVITGGLVGWNNGRITDCAAEGDIAGGTDTGGLAGWNDSKILQCRFSGHVSGMNDNTGGLIGTNMGSLVSESFSTGTVDGGNFAGGLSGISWSGTVLRCYSTSDVTGSDSVGGLVGELSASEISGCFSSGNVTGTSRYVGGLGGSNYSARIFDCYSTSEVSGNEYVGGLLGWSNWGTVVHCYSMGTIRGTMGTGGLIGYIFRDTILDSFWDMETSGQTTSVGGTGKTTAEMKILKTFTDAGWDFVYSDGNAPAWKMPAGGYPALFWEYRYSGGSGTVEDPYQIRTAEDMNTIGIHPDDWGKSFILMADTDLGPYDGREGNPAFNIIAPDANDLVFDYQGTPFSGVFDGNDYTISGLTIVGTDKDFIGLFGCVDGPGAEIRNVRLTDSNVHAGIRRYAGSLMGRLGNGVITNCSTSGEVTGYKEIGGLIGYCVNGIIRHSSSAARVSSVDDYSGGLIAHMEAGTLSDSSVQNAIVKGSHHVGGLVGYTWKGVKVLNCQCCDSVINGFQYIGGIVGNSFGEVAQCRVETCDLEGSYHVGGMVGLNSRIVLWSSVVNCSIKGTENGAGGLAGGGGGMSYCYADAIVTGNNWVGGISGNLTGKTQFCYSRSSVSGRDRVGGLVGWHGSGYWNGQVSNCYSIGKVQGISRVGGLAGDGTGTVQGSFWDIETSGQAFSAGGTGLTTGEMKTKATFVNAGWDFVGEAANGAEDVWRMCTDDVNYPRLSWEFSQGGDMDCPDGVAMEDLVYLAGRWMGSTPATMGAADADGNGKVDLSDFETLASNWMR